MYRIDFKQTPRQAFWHGFLKGMAAPVMLFDPEPLPKIPPARFIEPRVADVPGVWGAIGSDWRRVLGDFGRAIEQGRRLG
jgi:hypothetical protein